MSETITLHRRVKFGRLRQVGPTEENSGSSAAEPAGRLPRVTRLMALAVRLERLLAEGQIPSAARMAELGHVSQARLTQIRNLTLLAPDLQEALLFLPQVRDVRAPITERDLRPIVAEPLWSQQREMWAELVAEGTHRQPASTTC